MTKVKWFGSDGSGEIDIYAKGPERTVTEQDIINLLQKISDSKWEPPVRYMSIRLYNEYKANPKEFLEKYWWYNY